MKLIANRKLLNSNMPNVLGLVSFRVFPTHMGGQKGVACFYKYLQQHFNVLLAVSTDNQESGIVRTKKVLNPNRQIYKNVFRRSQLKQIVRSNKIDIVIAEHSYVGWLAWLLQKSTGIPFIIHSHNIESRRFQQMQRWWWKLYHWYEGWIHRKAQYNFFISDEDMDFALRKFHLLPQNCSVVTYGVEPVVLQNKAVLRKQLNLAENKIILLFNGTLDYEPNYEAVENIVKTIEPLLRKKLKNYEIVITGNRAPKKLIEKILTNSNVSYLGYVDDVNLFYQAADIFINPVSNDTGVKTKLIEAIANNCTAVSTESGASGIRKDLCGDKLLIAKVGDWNCFVDKIMQSLNQYQQTTGPVFYEHYSWEAISKKAAKEIMQMT